ncbi:MAG: alpha/beta hydrolase fold domain-containing protein [Chitinivibrionales bacterium]|nr:alpha/beta hydrolase fold domain-containing protein [Chitinivibrionales bacterium]
MPSFRSKLFIFILRHKHLLEGKLKQTESVSARTSVKNLREQVEKGAGFFGKLPKGFSLDPVNLDGLEMEWMTPDGIKRDKVILYFHGGGLVLGSIHAHRGIVAKFVKESNVPALLFNYGLAPENPYPKALHDSIAAYQYLLDYGINPKRIVFMGDSGGGNLVYTTMLALKEKGIPLPCSAVTLSPWTDLTNSGNSWKSNEPHDNLIWRDAQSVFADYYAKDQDKKDPLISPLFGDLSRFPPLQIFAGGHELMRDDATRFADKAERYGVEVSLTIGDGLFHCYPACAPIFPEATKALSMIGNFIKEKTGT